MATRAGEAQAMAASDNRGISSWGYHHPEAMGLQTQDLTILTAKVIVLQYSYSVY